MTMRRLEGKVALVTGVGSSGPGWGNGKAIAVSFARAGARICGCDIRFEAAEETRAIIESEGGECIVRHADVASTEQLRALADECAAHFGRIDILVNNVGIVELGGPVETTEAKWQHSLDVNLSGIFLTCKHVLPHMERQGAGAIVHIGSIAGIRYSGVPYVSYATTKAAVLGLSRSVALQYAKQGIRSNVVLPGLMNTPMVVEPLKQAYGGGDIEKMMAVRDAQCPMGHMGDAWDVANAALFLASDEARYITGAELVVDGGISAKFA